MNKPRTKTPDPIVPDSALEEKAQELMNSPQTSLAITEDVRLEKVKKAGGGDKLAARARSGKFVSRTQASAMVTAKDTQNFLTEVDPETGLSRHKSLLNKLYEGAKRASQTDKGIGGAVKAVELIDEMSGHRAAREEAIAQANKEVQNRVIAVNINMPVLINPQLVDFEEQLRKRKERDAKGPSFIDAEFKTNPPKE